MVGVETAPRDFTGPGIAFFTNLRVPAALLATTAIRDAFVLQKTPEPYLMKWDRERGLHRSRAWRALRYAYCMSMLVSFALEVNVIFMTTQVSTQMATATFDGEATSLVALLIREFEFEYVTTRFQFVSGLLTYIMAQGLRVRYQLRKYTSLSYSAMMCMMCTAAGMLTYTNSQTISYGGFLGLFRRHFVLALRFISARLAQGPMALVTLAAAVVTFAFSVASLVRGAPDFFGYDEEGSSDGQAAQG